MISCERMKFLEKKADKAGLSYYQMMENAGRCATILAMGNVPRLIDGSGNAIIFCGKGNNGRDGFVVARLLASYGSKVSVFLVDGLPVTPDAITNFKLLKKIDRVEIVNLQESSNINLHPQISNSNIIIDAIYGTGFRGELREFAAKIISQINDVSSTGTFTLSLDIPSGLPGNISEKECIGTSVIASATITFHDKKQIHEYSPAQKRIGKITVGDIGINSILD